MTEHRKILNYSGSYHATMERIRDYVAAGGSLTSDELYDDDLLDSLLNLYADEFGLLRDKDQREAGIELKDRKSGILNDLEWLQQNGFSFEEDCKRLLQITDDDIVFNPLSTAADYALDYHLFDYLVENGFYDLLNAVADPLYPDETIMDCIWSAVDSRAEDVVYIEDENYDFDTVFSNMAVIFRRLIYYGCQERGGLAIVVHKDLRISFSRPKMMY